VKNRGPVQERCAPGRDSEQFHSNLLGGRGGGIAKKPQSRGATRKCPGGGNADQKDAWGGDRVGPASVRKGTMGKKNTRLHTRKENLISHKD